MEISKETAGQIVESVKEVCGCNINFISASGEIMASTDPERIGTYHEAGYQAAQTGHTLEVSDDQSFHGTQMGVNMPVLWHEEIVAVIEISGQPDEVRKYAALTQKICRLILREWELGLQSRNGRDEIDYFVRSLIHGVPLNSDFIRDFMEKKKLQKEDRYITICVSMEERCTPEDSFMVEEDIRKTFGSSGNSLYTYEYPNKYILIMEEERARSYSFLYHVLAREFSSLLKIGIGGAHSLVHQNRSYQEAETAVKALRRFPRMEERIIADYRNLDLEVLLDAVPEEKAKEFSHKVLGKLSKKEMEVLKTYLDCGCRLKEAANELFIHENTMKYQLRKICEETGLNPKTFDDAVVLSLAMRLSEV